MAAMMIGAVPHKGSHTAVAIDPAEMPLGELIVRAGASQAGKLLEWAAASGTTLTELFGDAWRLPSGLYPQAGNGRDTVSIVGQSPSGTPAHHPHPGPGRNRRLHHHCARPADAPVARPRGKPLPAWEMQLSG